MPSAGHPPVTSPRRRPEDRSESFSCPGITRQVPRPRRPRGAVRASTHGPVEHAQVGRRPRLDPAGGPPGSSRGPRNRSRAASGVTASSGPRGWPARRPPVDGRGHRRPGSALAVGRVGARGRPRRPRRRASRSARGRAGRRRRPRPGTGRRARPTKLGWVTTVTPRSTSWRWPTAGMTAPCSTRSPACGPDGVPGRQEEGQGRRGHAVHGDGAIPRRGPGDGGGQAVEVGQLVVGDDQLHRAPGQVVVDRAGPGRP